jgi:hypothetical protein
MKFHYPTLGSFEWKLPGADNNQVIAPFTPWFSNVTLNAKGNPEIESRIVTEVASYGRQLGIITEAVLAIADGQKSKKDKDRVQRLRDLVEQIDAVKAANVDAIADEIERQTKKLAEMDPDRAAALLATFAAEVERAKQRKDEDPLARRD